VGVVRACREACRYWVREVIGGAGRRAELRRTGIDVGSVSLRRLGLDPVRAHNHANSGGPDLELVLRELGVGPDDSILDLGSGKGGALLSISAFPFRRIAGLELSHEMLDIARANLERARVANVELIQGDASEFTDYDGFSYIYMYNPFPCAVLRCVVDGLEASVRRTPRTLTVIYKNPRFHEEIVRNGIFALVRRFDHSGHPYFVYRSTRAPG